MSQLQVLRCLAGRNPQKDQLRISRYEKRIKLSFRNKPPSYIRREIRLRGFSWSRKHRYWRSYLTLNQLENTKKIYKLILKE